MIRCLTPAELLLYSLSSEGPPAIHQGADHVLECLSCQARLVTMRQRLDAASAPTAECFDEFALAELLEATEDGAIDGARIRHVASCPMCREKLEDLTGLVRNTIVRAELDRPEVRARRSVAGTRLHPAGVLIGGLAAAAALILAVRALTPDDGAPRTAVPSRHATIAAAAAPRLVMPLGTVSNVDTFTWTAVPNTDRYRITLFDQTGVTIWETEVADTFASVPRALLTRRADYYRWRVKARTSFDQWVDSEFGEFSLRAGNR